MAPHAFKLNVKAPVTVECKFWVENDGWIGTAEQLAITVHAGSFESAKVKMEHALAKHLQALLQGRVEPERRMA